MSLCFNLLGKTFLPSNAWGQKNFHLIIRILTLDVKSTTVSYTCILLGRIVLKLDDILKCSGGSLLDARPYNLRALCIRF